MHVGWFEAKPSQHTPFMSGTNLGVTSPSVIDNGIAVGSDSVGVAANTSRDRSSPLLAAMATASIVETAPRRRQIAVKRRRIVRSLQLRATAISLWLAPIDAISRMARSLSSSTVGLIASRWAISASTLGGKVDRPNAAP